MKRKRFRELDYAQVTNESDTVDHKMSTLAISSLLEKKEGTEEVPEVKTCCPTSLLKWLKKRKIESPYKRSDKRNCMIKIPEIKDETAASKSSNRKWNDLDKDLRKNRKHLKDFPRVRT